MSEESNFLSQFIKYLFIATFHICAISRIEQLRNIFAFNIECMLQYLVQSLVAIGQYLSIRACKPPCFIHCIQNNQHRGLLAFGNAYVRSRTDDACFCSLFDYQTVEQLVYLI